MYWKLALDLLPSRSDIENLHSLVVNLFAVDRAAIGQAADNQKPHGPS